MGLLWFFLVRRRKQIPKDIHEAGVETQRYQPAHELPVGARDGRSELESDYHMRSELPAEHKAAISELDTERNR